MQRRTAAARPPDDEGAAAAPGEAAPGAGGARAPRWRLGAVPFRPRAEWEAERAAALAETGGGFGDRFGLLCSPAALKALGTKAAVMAVLLRRFNAARGAAWPVVPTIAKETGRSERQVFRALDALEAAGLISRERRAGGRVLFRFPGLRGAFAHARPGPGGGAAPAEGGVSDVSGAPEGGGVKSVSGGVSKVSDRTRPHEHEPSAPSAGTGAVRNGAWGEQVDAARNLLRSADGLARNGRPLGWSQGPLSAVAREWRRTLEELARWGVEAPPLDEAFGAAKMAHILNRPRTRHDRRSDIADALADLRLRLRQGTRARELPLLTPVAGGAAS